jgi:secondary thiamine-phosphate synthase enzyme
MVKTHTLRLATQGDSHVIDITRDVASALAETKLKDGIVALFCPGSTGGLTTLEFEDGAVRDLQDCFERLAPRGDGYRHEQAWHDGNGHSHIRAALLGPSMTVPFTAGALVLGTWQQIVFIDFDNRPRQRDVVLQFIGE